MKSGVSVNGATVNPASIDEWESFPYRPSSTVDPSSKGGWEAFHSIVHTRPISALPPDVRAALPPGCWYLVDGLFFIADHLYHVLTESSAGGPS